MAESYGARLQQLREELDEVERAMERVEAGSYGSCQRCGRAIGPDVMERNPLARNCGECETA